MRLLRAWGEADPRLASYEVDVGWRDDGTFVALDRFRSRRCVELDPRSGAHRTYAVGDGMCSMALLPGARAAVRARLRSDSDATEVEEVALPTLAVTRRWTVEGAWLLAGAACGQGLVLEQPLQRDYPVPRYGGPVAVAPIGGSQAQVLAGARSQSRVLEGGRWLVTVEDGGLACWDLEARTLARRQAIEGEWLHLGRAVGASRVSAWRRGGTVEWDVLTGAFVVVPRDERERVVARRSSGDVEVCACAHGEVRWSREGAVEEARTVGGFWLAWVSPQLDHVVVANAMSLGVVRRDGPSLACGWPSHPSALAWSNAGQALAVLDDDARVWEVEGDREVWSLEGSCDYDASTCFDGAGRVLYGAGITNVVGWDLSTGVEAFCDDTGLLGQHQLACSAEGDRVVAWLAEAIRADAPALAIFEGGRVRSETLPPDLWELDLRPSSGNLWVVVAGFDAAGRLVVVVGGSSTRVLRRDRDGRWETLSAHLGTYLGEADPASLRDGSRLVFQASEGALRVIEFDGWRERDVPCASLGRVWAAGERSVVGARRDGAGLVRYDLASGELLDEVDLDEAIATVERVAVSRDDRRVAVALSSGVVLAFEAP